MFDFEATDTAAPAPVVLLSGGLGSAGEWKSVAGALGPGFAPSCFTEAAKGVEAIAATPAGAHLVAHGTAAHSAILAASVAPWLVRSLTLIDADLAPALPDLGEPRVHRPALAMRTNVATFVAEGDAWNATREAVDFWMGRGAFASSSTGLQRRLAARIGRLCRAWKMQSAHPLDVETLAGVVCPTLMLTGRLAVAELREIQRDLALRIPFAARARIPGTGACSHLTDPHLAGPVIRDFLVRTNRAWHYPSMGMSAAA
jgi:pimeloyl-ACP methyl ester carboxylesterase